MAQEFGLDLYTLRLVFSSSTPRSAHGVRSPFLGYGRPRSEQYSWKMFRRLGGSAADGDTENARPFACPGPW